MIGTVRVVCIAFLLCFLQGVLSHGQIDSQVGLRPLPVDSNQAQEEWLSGIGNYQDWCGEFDFVAEHTDVVMDWQGCFQTTEKFFEYYVGIEHDWIDMNPYTNDLVQRIKGCEDLGGSVKHILICREGELLGKGKVGPFPEDTRILYKRDITELRQVFSQAFSLGILQKDNYKLIQMVSDASFFASDNEAKEVINMMDGVCYESHQFNSHWPYEDSKTNPVELIKGANWTLDNDLDYVFYYGPFRFDDCIDYYSFAERDYLYRFWEAGLPKYHSKMHYYLNAFPHACGENRPVGPESNPSSYLGMTKWLIQEVKQSITSSPIKWLFSGSSTGWTIGHDLEGRMSGESYILNVSGIDPYVFSPDNVNADASIYEFIRIKMRNQSSATTAKIYFLRDDELGWSEDLSFSFDIIPFDNDFTEYTLDLREHPGWKGNIKQIRFDCTENVPDGVVELQCFELLKTTRPVEWNFLSDNEGWGWINDMEGSVAGGTYDFEINGFDPYVYSPDNLGIDASIFKYVRIKMQNRTLDTIGKLYFLRDDGTGWSEELSQSFILESNSDSYDEYLIDLSDNQEWYGMIKRIRIDPIQNLNYGQLSIDYVKLSQTEKFSPIEWNFDESDDGWWLANSLGGGVYEGIFHLNVMGGDPYMYSANNLNIDASVYKYLKMRLKNSTLANEGKVYFMQEDHPYWNENMSECFVLNSNDNSYTEYIVDLSSNPYWTGTIKRIRLDPVESVSSGEVKIDYMLIDNNLLKSVENKRVVDLEEKNLIDVKIRSRGNNIIYIEIPKNYSRGRLSLYNLSGKMVFNRSLRENSIELTIGDYPSGVYLMVVETNIGKAIKKFVF